MKKIINFVALFIFIISMTGCATILKPKETQMKVTSEPEGADVYQTVGRVFRRDTTMRAGRTPTIITLDNKHPAQLAFKKEGYEESVYITKPHINNGWMLASFLCGIMPAFIDLVSKNALSFKESEIRVTLDPVLSKQTDQNKLNK